ncbi:MAG: NAD-dependent deacetylase [Alphaproteobacteria bacterium]|nr:NAD-dependent deacetylase [Alphaproteobacteria bacterium]
MARSSMADGDAAARLADLIGAARHAVAFTGAGLSTESGIPDFRSTGGIWDRFKPIEYADFLASEDARRAFWERKFATHPTVAGAQPNRGHRALAALVAAGRLAAIVTQNIDGLHQRAGVAADRVIELHGNTTYAECLDCAARFELEPIRVAFETHGTTPRCGCGGLVKTATIAFGQVMPAEPMRRAREETLAANLFLAMGTSLVVYPAAGFPLLAKRNGARLVIVNREPTPLDAAADLVVRAEIGPLLGAVTGAA